MDDANFETLTDKLDQKDWPSDYMFKFIVPSDNESELLMIFKDEVTTSRPSKNGKYISITSTVFALSSEAVIEIYKEAAKVEGVIAL
jgi:putative lipoic acid-binding regulatory protein